MKMIKILKSLIVIGTLLCVVSLLFACSDANLNMSEKDPNGGNSVAQITVTFMDGEEELHSSKDLDAVLDYVPEEKEGYTFDGWYLDAEWTEEFTKKPSKNLTVYGKWTIKTFSVRFINNDGSVIQVNGEDYQTIEYGQSATAPEDPTLVGHEFLGWSVDFSEVKSDLVVRANFGTAKQSIIIYGEDGEVLVSEKAEVGSDISVKFNTLLDSAEQALPGGLALNSLCIDEELQVPYEIPSDEHIMPLTDLVLYVKVDMQDVEGLRITPSRNEFRYDLNGFTLNSSLYDNAIITYTYEWRDENLDEVVSGENGKSLRVPCKDVGEYTYSVKVKATYKDLEPKYATTNVTVTVLPGTLEGIVSVAGMEGVYNGLVREPIFTGALADDVITYRRKGETTYGANPIKDAGDYNVETKIERKNYEALELDAVQVTITRAPLELSVSLPITNILYGAYRIYYGSAVPYINYEITGFVNGETESVLDGTAIRSNPYTVGTPVGEYTLGIDKNSWTTNNYEFVAWGSATLEVIKRALTINVDEKQIIYGDDAPTFTASLEGAIPSDVDKIKAEIQYVCEYDKDNDELNDVLYDKENGSIIGYAITATYVNDSYNVKFNHSFLKVNPKMVTVTPGDITLTYGDPTPYYNVEIEGLIGEDSIGRPQASCAYSFGSNVANYPITVREDLVNPNYAIHYGVGNLKVNPKAITLTLKDSSITYFDDIPSRESFASLLTVEGLISGDTINDDLKASDGKFTFSSRYAKGQPVGEYEVIVGGYYSNNYVINNNEGVKGVLIVNKRALTIRVVDSEVIYGEELEVDVTYEGLVGDEYYNSALAVSGGEIVGGYSVGDGVGSTTVSVGNYYADNYEISYVEGTITVKERPLTLKARGYTTSAVQWDGVINSTENAIKVEPVGLYSGDDISGTISSVDSTRGVYVTMGELNASFSWNSENGLAITRNESDMSGNYTISYDLQVAIDTTGVFVSANSVVYDGNSHGLDVERLEGFEDLDLAKVYYSENGGEYSETEVLKTTPGTYSIAYKIYLGEEERESGELQLVISPRPITIVATDITITYGDDEPTLSYEEVPYEEGAKVYADGDDITKLGSLSIVAEDYEGNAGYYDITISGLANENYEITIVNGLLTVERKALTLTAGSFSITYGDPLPDFSYVAEGFVKEESVESLGNQVLYNYLYTADANGRAGKFSITPVLSLDNYKITAIDGTLTVSKKAITLTADSKSVIFGDDTPTLTATPSALAYNDTVATIGDVSLATTYERGKSVGKYTITISGTSEKYEFKLVNGTIQVSKKEVALTWTGVKTYVYDGTDHSSAVTATYVDIDGNIIYSSIAFNASNSTPNVLKNAGTYTVKSATADGNYTLLDAQKEIVMQKATYSEITYLGEFSGVYNPEKTLASGYLLEGNGYRWATPDLVPTVDVSTYKVLYNLDTENYFDFEIDVTISLTPALISLSITDESVATIYDISEEIDVNSTDMNPTYILNPLIWWIDGNKAANSALYSLTFSNGTEFTPGTYLTTMTFNSVNFKLNTADGSQVIKYFIKYKSVVVGSTLYTVEDALNVATSGNVILRANATFANQQEVISRYYGSTSYYTVKSGVTLLLPLSATDTSGFLQVGEAGSDEYNAHPVGTTDANPPAVLYITLNVPENVTITVNGTLTVGAVTGRQLHGYKQGAISGNYSQINLQGNVVANSATINVHGYVVGSGKITATGSTQVTETMYISGWKGGSISAALFIGNDSVFFTEFISGGTFSVDNPVMFPFCQYEVRSIQANLEMQYGSSLRGAIKISTSEQYIVKAKINLAYTTLVSSSTDAGSGLIRMMDSTSKVTKSFASDRVRFTTDGTVQDGYSSLNILVIAKTVSLKSEKVFFPIDGRVDIVVNSGTFTQNYQYKMMPGSTLTIKSGATYNMNGTIVTYKEGFVDVGPSLYPAGRGDAKVIVEGTLNVNGSFGGDIYGVSGGKVAIGANATITSVKSIEGSGSMARDGLSVVFTFTESGSVTRNLEFHNASGGTASGTKGTTYTYDGSSWA